jgi:hypothetical protein
MRVGTVGTADWCRPSYITQITEGSEMGRIETFIIFENCKPNFRQKKKNIKIQI